ncbi:hypothetical protein SASPL_131253 [Salvia splendens]|uniref:Uncharacterized protein n=1 Tax=Salvia splendens TaxID=180675 RepID=A0A8X8X8W7_SALSN|nr:hypothetical protein SASPL_131253 [Salvia splendens]
MIIADLEADHDVIKFIKLDNCKIHVCDVVYPEVRCPTLGKCCLCTVVSFFSLSHISVVDIYAGVDLRSSKVCELGLFNYKAKHVFYPFERKKYRCHYDYYWASVFEHKVEYVDHSGQARYASAEAPKEALPYKCRPNFGAAWLTKDKFKVNETYECWYTLGVSKVNINNEGLFNCQAEDPDTVEMLKRYSILMSYSVFILVYKVTEVMGFRFGINTPMEMGSNSWSYFRLYNVLSIHYLNWSSLPVARHHSPTFCILDFHASPKYYFIKESLFLCSVFFLYELGHRSIRAKARPVIDVYMLTLERHSIFQ